MRRYSFTVDDVTKACLGAFNKLLPELPDELASRLVPNRKARSHGNETRMCEFHIRDKWQPQILDKRYFGYTVIYDPVCRYHTWFRDRGYPCQLLVRFYANRHRIYDKAQVVVEALWNEMLAAERDLHGFVAHQNDQLIGVFRPFDVVRKSDLAGEIYHAFLELVPYWHQHYAAAIDAYGHDLSKNDVREIIAGRKKFQPSRPRSPVARPEYSRQIPARLRQAVLKRDGGSCMKCGSTRDLEIDHVIPIAKGGLTVMENLQVLCARHNRSKGDRESVRY